MILSAAAADHRERSEIPELFCHDDDDDEEEEEEEEEVPLVSAPRFHLAKFDAEAGGGGQPK